MIAGPFFGRIRFIARIMDRDPCNKPDPAELTESGFHGGFTSRIAGVGRAGTMLIHLVSIVPAFGVFHMLGPIIRLCP
jgi:hypothetical protein